MHYSITGTLAQNRDDYERTLSSTCTGTLSLDLAGDSQIGIPPAQADPFSLGNVTVVRVRSACARPGWGPGVTGPPSENRAKTFCLAYRWAEKALPISCLFCAPTAGISRQSKATPRNSQGFGRKEVRLKSAIVSKTGKIEVKRIDFGC